jgi:hypothetical protein
VREIETNSDNNHKNKQTYKNYAYAFIAFSGHIFLSNSHAVID